VVLNVAGVALAGAALVEDERRAAAREVVRGEIRVEIRGLWIVHAWIGQAEREPLSDRIALHRPAHLQFVGRVGPTDRWIEAVIVERAVGAGGDGRVIE